MKKSFKKDQAANRSTNKGLFIAGPPPPPGSACHNWEQVPGGSRVPRTKAPPWRPGPSPAGHCPLSLPLRELTAHHQAVDEDCPESAWIWWHWWLPFPARTHFFLQKGFGFWWLIVAVLSLSCVQLFATLWTAACQASLSFTNSWGLLKFMSPESVMPSNHLILCHPLLLPSILPSIRVFSSEWAQWKSFS